MLRIGMKVDFDYDIRLPESKLPALREQIIVLD